MSWSFYLRVTMLAELSNLQEMANIHFGVGLLFNIILFCLAIKLFIITKATKRDQAIVAYVSGSIMLVSFVCVFHVLTRGLLYREKF